MATQLALAPHDISDMENSNATLIYNADGFIAYSQDVECMWQWMIYQNNQLIQEGCSLTFDASKRAVNHVLAFLGKAKIGVH